MKKIAVVLVLLASTSVTATVRYVDNLLSADTATYSIANRNDSGSDGNGYKTIASAISAVAAGDTVYIRSGTYSLTARLTISSKVGTDAEHKITFCNYDSEAVTVDGSGAGSSSYRQLWEVTSSPYVVIRGISIVNASQTTLGFTDSDYCEVNDVAIDASTYYGIHVYTSDHVSITGCEIENTTTEGIRSYKSDYLTVSDCYIHDITGNYGNGIEIQGGSYCLIDRNEIAGTAGGFIVTWYTHDGEPNTISAYNIITNNILRNNTVNAENADGGALSTGTYDCFVAGNIFYGNADDGFDASTGGGFGAGESSCERHVIAFNISFDNGAGGLGDGNGFKVSTNAGGGHRIVGNIAFDNPRAGFDQDKAEEYPCNYFYHNTAYNNTVAGFYMDDPGSVNLAILKNNIGYANAGKDLRRTSYAVSVQYSDYNFWGDAQFVPEMDSHSLSGNPQFSNPSLDMSITFQAGWTIDQKLTYIRGQARSKLGLSPASTAIDAGGFLTTITSNSGSGTSFVVSDPNWFSADFNSAGTQLESLETSAGRKFVVSGVDRYTKALTISSSISWTVGDGIGLRYTLVGPDMGAYERSANKPVFIRVAP